MGRPPFVALFGRLPQDASSLIELSCRYRSTNEGLLPQTDTAGNSFSCSMGLGERSRAASRLPNCWDGAAIVSRRISVLNDESILSNGVCQIRTGVAAISQGFFHAGHKWDTFAVFMKKGTSAESRNPFHYCDGAEGGI